MTGNANDPPLASAGDIKGLIGERSARGADIWRERYQARALELRALGLTYRQIAARLNVPEHRVAKLFRTPRGRLL